MISLWDYFFHHAEGIAAMFAIVAGVCGLLAMAYRVVRKVDDTFKYVDALKTNHIPHLQTAVESIAKFLGIDLPQS